MIDINSLNVHSVGIKNILLSVLKSQYLNVLHLNKYMLSTSSDINLCRTEHNYKYKFIQVTVML